MGKKNNYTLAQIILKYKEILLSLDIISILKLLNCEAINKVIANAGKNLIVVNDKTKNDLIEKIVLELRMNPSINNNRSFQIDLLAEIYRRVSKTMTPKEVEELKDLILVDNPIAIYTYDDDKYPGLKAYEIITRNKQEKTENISNDRKRRIFEYIFTELRFGTNARYVLKQKYTKQVFDCIVEDICKKYFLDEGRMSLEEYKECKRNGTLAKILAEDNGIRSEIGYFFRDNLQYVDERMLIITATINFMNAVKELKSRRNIERLGISGDYNKKISEYIQIVRECFKLIQKMHLIDEDLYYSGVEEKGEKQEITKKNIEEFLRRCTEDDYITDEEIEEIHKKSHEGILPENLQLRRIAGLNKEDLLNMNDSYNDKEKTEEEKQRILEGWREFTNYLKSDGKLTAEEIIDLYISQNINLDLVLNSDISEVSNEYYSGYFKKLYLEFVFSQDEELKENQKEKLRRFSDLYINLREKVDINENELIEYFTNFFGQEYKAEILHDLYSFGIIPIEKAIEVAGGEFFYIQYKKGEFEPSQARALFDAEVIDYTEIIDMVTKIPENSDKYMVIGSIFPNETEDDKDIREMLVDECITLDSEMNSREKGKKRKPKEKTKKDYSEHVTDPFARLKLMQLLDEHYSFEMTIDGHAVLKLPSRNKVIIEKMINENGEASHGYATYVFDKEYYENNSFRYFENKKVNRRKLVEEGRLKNASQIIHVVGIWERKIKEVFDIREESIWTKEQLKEFEEAFARIRRSERIIGE